MLRLDLAALNVWSSSIQLSAFSLIFLFFICEPTLTVTVSAAGVEAEWEHIQFFCLFYCGGHVYDSIFIEC